MGISRTVNPTTLPVSVAKAKKQVEIADSLRYHDATLESLIRWATREVERRTDHALITQTWKLTLDRFPDWEIKLPKPPLQSVTSITYQDTSGVQQTLSTSDYKVSTNSNPGRITPSYGKTWPTTRTEMESVSVTYVCGYGESKDVPSDFKRAILVSVDHGFDPDQSISDPEANSLPGAAISLCESLHSGMKYGSYGVTK